PYRVVKLFRPPEKTISTLPIRCILQTFLTPIPTIFTTLTKPVSMCFFRVPKNRPLNHQRCLQHPHPNPAISDGVVLRDWKKHGKRWPCLPKTTTWRSPPMPCPPSTKPKKHGKRDPLWRVFPNLKWILPE